MVSVTVDTSISNFDDALKFALELAQNVTMVTFSHNGSSVDVCPEWNIFEIWAAWQITAMERAGRGIYWRDLETK
jgi:hypothetical protein